MCVDSPGELRPPSFERRANTLIGLCGEHMNMACLGAFYVDWDNMSSSEVCTHLGNWGCCAGIVEVIHPEYTSLCPTYEHVDVCGQDWVGDYTPQFCDNCPEDAEGDGCGVISPFLCQIGMRDRLDYCSNPACAMFGQQPGNDDEACIAATVAEANERCQEPPSDDSSSSDDRPNCRRCNRRDSRQLNFMSPLPCC